MGGFFNRTQTSERLYRTMTQIAVDTTSLIGKFNNHGEFVGSLDDVNALRTVHNIVVLREDGASKEQPKATKKDLDVLKRELEKADTVLDLIFFVPDVWESEVKSELEHIGKHATYVRVIESLLTSTKEEWCLKEKRYGHEVLEELANELKRKSEFAFKRLRREIDDRAEAKDPYAVGMQRLLHNKQAIELFCRYEKEMEGYSASTREEGLTQSKIHCSHLYWKYVKTYGTIFTNDDEVPFSGAEAATLPKDSAIPRSIVSGLKKQRSVDILTEILQHVPYRWR